MIPVLKFDKRNKEHLLVVSGNKPLSILLDKGINDDTGIFKSHTTAKRIRAISLDRDDTLPHVKFQNTQQEYDVYSIENDISESIITPCAETKNKTGSDQDKGAYISEIASSCHAQILVTNNERLLTKRISGEYSPVNYLTDQQALAYVGFLGRTQGKYNLASDYTATRQGAYWCLAYDLLSVDMYKIVQALSQTCEGSDIARRTIARVSEMLKSRDYVHQQVLARQMGGASDDMMYYFEHYLVSAVAAYDTLARIVNKIYKPISNKDEYFEDYQVSWSLSGRWVKSIKSQAPTIYGTFKNHQKIYSLVNILRNYIHGEGISKPGISTSNGKLDDPKLYVPKESVSQIGKIMKILDSRGEWRKNVNKIGVIDFDLVDFIERSLPLITKSLREIVSSIELDKIQDVEMDKIKDEFSGDWPPRDSLDSLRSLFGIEARS